MKKKKKLLETISKEWKRIKNFAKQDKMANTIFVFRNRITS